MGAPCERALATAIPGQPAQEHLIAFYDANAERFTLTRRKPITYPAPHPRAADRQHRVSEPAAPALRGAGAEFAARAAAGRTPGLPRRGGRRCRAGRDRGGRDRFRRAGRRSRPEPDDVDLGDVARDDLGAARRSALRAGGAEHRRSRRDLARPRAVPRERHPRRNRRPSTRCATTSAPPYAREPRAAQIDAAREPVADLLAGGATLEELAAETDMALGTAQLRPGASGATSITKRSAAQPSRHRKGTSPSWASCPMAGSSRCGSTRSEPPRTPELEEVRDRVEQAWRDDDDAAWPRPPRRWPRASRRAKASRRSGWNRTPDRLARDGVVEGLPARPADRLSRRRKAMRSPVAAIRIPPTCCASTR